MKLSNEMKITVGQEYFKRKIFRKMAEWFRIWITQYPSEVVMEMIRTNQSIIDDLEKELMKKFPKEKVAKYLNEIELYKNSITVQDKDTLMKMIYFRLPEYRDVFNENQSWINEQVKQSLIEFDSYIYKVKHDL